MRCQSPHPEDTHRFLLTLISVWTSQSPTLPPLPQVEEGWNDLFLQTLSSPKRHFAIPSKPPTLYRPEWWERGCSAGSSKCYTLADLVGRWLASKLMDMVCPVPWVLSSSHSFGEIRKNFSQHLRPPYSSCITVQGILRPS